MNYTGLYELFVKHNSLYLFSLQKNFSDFENIYTKYVGWLMILVLKILLKVQKRTVG